MSGRAVVRVEVDRDVCVGAGNCVMSTDEVFDQDEHGLVRLLLPSPPTELTDRVELAARLCPAAAITVHASAERI